MNDETLVRLGYDIDLTSDKSWVVRSKKRLSDTVAHGNSYGGAFHQAMLDNVANFSKDNAYSLTSARCSRGTVSSFRGIELVNDILGKIQYECTNTDDVVKYYLKLDKEYLETYEEMDIVFALTTLTRKGYVILPTNDGVIVSWHY